MRVSWNFRAIGIFVYTTYVYLCWYYLIAPDLRGVLEHCLGFTFTATFVLQAIALLRCTTTSTFTRLSSQETESLSNVSYLRCNKCGALQTSHTEHCSLCNQCIFGRDHHCGILNHCVDQSNHKYFICFLLNADIASICGSVTSVEFVRKWFKESSSVENITLYLRIRTYAKVVFYFVTSITACALTGLILMQFLSIVLNKPMYKLLYKRRNQRSRGDNENLKNDMKIRKKQSCRIRAKKGWCRVFGQSYIDVALWWFPVAPIHECSYKNRKQE